MEEREKNHCLQAMKRHFDEIQKEAKNAVGPSNKVSIVNGNIRHWEAQIYGPMNTAYEGGNFKVDI